MNTFSPGHFIVLYDGHCSFCTAAAKKLLHLGRPGALTAQDFQESGVLDQFPGLTHEACMKQMQLVTPDGKIYSGFEAAVQALVTRRWLRFVVFGYYLPGVRQLCDWLYRCVAANRYRLWGRTPEMCKSGTCALHLSSK